MKLRNKQTGEIQNPNSIVITDDSEKDGVFVFRSIEQLVEEYEDYKPKEPLIKDEKIRKAIKYIFPECGLIHIEKQGGSRIFRFGGTRLEIYAPDENAITHGCTYLVAELCGEEEAPEPIEPTFINLDERVKEKEENANR